MTNLEVILTEFVFKNRLLLCGNLTRYVKITQIFLFLHVTHIFVNFSLSQTMFSKIKQVIFIVFWEKYFYN